ncbi:centrosomal protein of 70 kDa [Rhinophrynus dorsalis]
MCDVSSQAKEETFQEELAEWENINHLLRRHGCRAVGVCEPQEGEAGAVVLDHQASLAVKCALKSLVEDTERRQNLIHGLIQSNNQLKEDVRQQQGRAARQEQKARELQSILDNVKAKIRDLEDDFISKTCQQQSHVKSLLKDKQTAAEQCQKHQDKLREQEENIAHLQQRLSQAVTEEDKRMAQQKKVFMRLVSRPPRENNMLDQQILEIIDGYERQVNRLQEEIRMYQGVGSDVPVRERKSSESSLDLDATPNYKALLKSYQQQIREARENNEQLVRENSQIRQELESRPSVREVKLYKQQVRRLEKILHQNNISFRGIIREKNEDKVAEVPSTRVQDIDQLPVGECRRYLQDACRELGVDDLKDLVLVSSSKVQQAETCSKYHKILSGISSVVSSPRAPPLLYKPSIAPPGGRAPASSHESDFGHLLPTIDMWAGQLLSLKALHRALRKLSERLLPYPQADAAQEATDSVRVEELLLLVDTMIEDVESQKQDQSTLSPHTLQALVSHFQKLFDVASVGGVYPRMNEVYSRLGEMSNMTRSLCCILGIDASSSSSVLVNTVWRLCKEVEEGGSQKLQHLLGTLDIDSVINKIQEHDEFFPAFEELVKDLLEVLGIGQLDEILPEVQRLKRLNSE